MQPALSVLVGFLLSSVFAAALPSPEPAALAGIPSRSSSDLLIRGSNAPPVYDLLVGGKSAYDHDFSTSAEPCEFDASQLGELVLLSAGAANGTLDRTPIKRGDGSDIDIVTRAPIADAAVAVFVNLGCNTVGGFTAYARVQRGRLTCMTTQFRCLFVCTSCNTNFHH